MQLFDIKDKVIIVTGGAGVLGGSIAEHLLREGAKVIIISRSEQTVADKLAVLQKLVRMF